MLTNRSFLRHAFVYGAASLLTSAAGFFLIPLYTRCLDRDEVGTLETIGRAAELAGIFLLVTGIKQGLMTLYQQKDSEPERRRTVGAALFLVFCASLLVGGVVFAAAPLLGRWLEEDSHLLRLAVLAIVLEPLHLLPLALMQARLESTRFLTITVSQFLTRVLLSILFVIWFRWGVGGALAATTVSGAIFAAVLTGRELWRGITWPDWSRTRGLLRFALPMLPSSLCFFVLQNGDRLVLRWWHGNAEVATYSLGYKLAQAVGTFSMVPLYMVWGSHLYAVAKTPEAPLVFGRAFTRILAVFLFVGLGVSLFEIEAIAVLGGSQYGAALPVIAPVLLASFFQSAASLMDAAFYVCHRTTLKLGITVAATVVMAVLYAVWIPAYGSMGAAFATLAGFAFLAVGTWGATQRIFPVIYEWRRLGGMLVLAGAFWLLSRPMLGWVIPLKSALWLSWPLVLWHMGLVSDEEKRYLASFWHRPLAETTSRQGELVGTAARG